MSDMHIYMLTSTADQGSRYDVYRGFLVIAHSRSEARETVVKEKFTNPGDIAHWSLAATSRCTNIGVYTGRYTRPAILMEDFNAG